MIEFYSNNNGDKVINFSEYGKIIIHGDSFIIEGNPTIIGIRFAKYSYGYFLGTEEYKTYHRYHVEIFDDKRHIMSINDRLNVHHFFKEKKPKFEIEWDGEKSEDFIKFKSAFDRYFSMPAFL